MVKSASKQRYIMESSGKSFYPYDGRRKYPYNDLNNEVCGSIHQARKNLNMCGWCNKQIKKGQFYVAKNALFLVDLPRVHLECDHNQIPRLYVIKKQKNNWFTNNICKRIGLADIQDFIKSRTDISSVSSSEASK